MENKDLASDIEAFKQKSVLAICNAGSDRSKYIAEVLNERGYFANHGGVLENHNYIEPNDLENVGSIVFASQYEKSIFDKNERLVSLVKNMELTFAYYI